ncbi:hypothetical protein FA95DRAFT_1201386 [Auriscalpium vulgare]|uniref:Uncharacterized protein n=1 Tax=Auriscalpium vulgare TaxID=40419 RepID=A0ACB8R3U6_9AGAM|nr:hypothetical protein FA95DRAFT_1201386 [Auriscalpium vulgare]
MIFALFFIFAAVQLLKLSEPFNHFASNVLTLGGPETDIGLMPAAPAPLSVDPLPVLLISPLPSSSPQVLEVVNAPQPSVGHTVISVDALIALEQGRQPQPSHVWSHATALSSSGWSCLFELPRHTHAGMP